MVFLQGGKGDTAEPGWGSGRGGQGPSALRPSHPQPSHLVPLTPAPLTPTHLPPIPALLPAFPAPLPVVAAEHVDRIPISHHGVFAAPAGGTGQVSGAGTPLPPSRPLPSSPGPHELVAGWEAAPAVHGLEGPEVEGEVLDAVRTAVVEVHAGGHLRAPRAARRGRGRRHGPGVPP